MTFDKSRVYTTLNADELKIGSKVVVANNLEDLMVFVERGTGSIKTVVGIAPCRLEYRFITENENKDEFCSSLVYLVEELQEQGLKWTDLNLGDVVRNKSCNLFFVVTGIDTNIKAGTHIHLAAYNKGGGWLTDEELKDWELVTESNNG